MKRLASTCLLGLAAWSCIASADISTSYKTPLNCNQGPVTKTFGNSSWLTYSCSDGKTVVLVTAPGSPAMPFVFTLFPVDGVYRVTGEGTGPKSATDPAYAELSKLSTPAFQGIIKETLAVPATPMPAQPTAPTPSCTESLPVTVGNLSGTWVSVNNPIHVTVQYSEDGSFSGKVEYDRKITWLYRGTWTLDGGKVSSLYTFSSLDPIPGGTKDVDQILGIGCGIAVWRSSSGQIDRYQRIKD